MRAERPLPARRYGAALFFLFLGILLGAWHNQATDRGHADMVAGVAREAVAPPANALRQASRWASRQAGWLFSGRALAVENQRLREQVAVLEQENATLRETKIDNDRLRGDLGFVRTTSARPLAADVIARRPDPKFDTLLIARGSRSGVRPHSVVVTRYGLVGRVMDVTPDTASVLMLTDQNAGVGARVQRAASRAVGVCKGNNTRLVLMVYLPVDADIRSGDVIVTSGLGGIYPPGLVIGTVVDVRADEGSSLKSARVRPRVDVDRLEEVYVLP